jgi:zinc and cadmium transporter
MDPLILWIIVFTALGGVLSVLAAGVFLLFSAEIRASLLAPLVSFAIGAMLGATFLGLLPEALEGPEPGARVVTVTVLFGLLVFFLLEKAVIWRHCHVDDCDAHGSASVAQGRTPDATDAHGSASVAHGGIRAAHHDHSEAGHSHGATARFGAQQVENARRLAGGQLVLIGDGIHNLVDGVLIAAAFMADVQLGIVTAIAVIAHEIPQEVGDFAILLNSGYDRARALWYNLLSSLTSIVGGVIAYFSLSFASQAVPYVLAVAAASFLYIAVADLIPGLHRRPEPGVTAQQILLILLGVGTIALTGQILH